MGAQKIISILRLARNNVFIKCIQYPGFAESSHAEEALVVVDGHDARDNWTIYSILATVMDKLEEDICIVEELGNYEICTSINLQNK